MYRESRIYGDFKTETNPKLYFWGHIYRETYFIKNQKSLHSRNYDNLEMNLYTKIARMNQVIFKSPLSTFKHTASSMNHVVDSVSPGLKYRHTSKVQSPKNNNTFPSTKGVPFVVIFIFSCKHSSVFGTYLPTLDFACLVILTLLFMGF